jgi:hypothetical protein
MFVCKDKHKTNEKLNRVFLKSHVPIEVTSEQFEVAWAGGELLDPADWADMPAGTCVEITWATLQGKRRDDDEVLTMEWLADVIDWHYSKEIHDRDYGIGWCVIKRLPMHDQGLRVQCFLNDVFVDVYGRSWGTVKTRGQFRALCKALGIEIKEGV